jgi:hypothetical protein
MRNLIFTILIFAFTSFTYSQTKAKAKAKATTKTATATTATTKCTAEISCSQKYGVTVTEREYTLTVIFDNKEIKFTTYENASQKGMNTYIVTKKTEKYVVASNSEGNYAFYNIKKKQFYYIDYYMSRYITAGYGSETSEIKQNVEKMMELLKKENTQKDVIQNLIKQAEYDF